ncbi:MAG: chromosome segregation protein SMC [Bacteroidales bacterium]|nr:chromosome segregation protein SMC [Clostridium sp.]MCM1202804.1 chromosome segregation protein SMC [Bacteroidales bacterium]
MYLKSIEVYGFKSFANRIVFEFNKGITGIVGPNGSGKSNVGDAVRWVLGEQSAKQLRGAKMEDVIFAGTELRKPHGSAYVAITLDNSDHSLPTSYEEVTVARRVYRSGESEYLINGTVSRLKDVHSLFFDTGIGKEGYSIIGQGQVEKILSGKPEERRELFDEAAGIVKYKKNKAATEKSLASERENLSRVNDILSELEKQVGPLEKQSEVAKKYLLYKGELKRFDVNVFLLENERIDGLLKENEEKLHIVNADSERLKAEFEQTKNEYERIETVLEQCSQSIDENRNKIHELKLQNEHHEGEVNVLNQQISNAQSTDVHMSEQIDRINQSLASQEKEKHEFQEKKAILDEKMDNADDVVEEAQAVSEGIEEEIAGLEEEIEKSKADIIEYLNDGANLKAKVGRYDAMLENINYRKTQLNQRFLQFKSDELKDKEEYDKQNTSLTEIENTVADILARLEVTDAKLDKNTIATNENKQRLFAANNEYSSVKSKLEALRNITERYDGYGNSIKRVMEQKENNPGIIGVVADIIQVNKEYEVAVETALGGSIQNIVTDNEHTAKRLIQYLKKNRYGRATFLPLTTIGGKYSEFTNKEALKEPGIIGLAKDLVKVHDKYSTVTNHLLGRILVADTIEHAIAVNKKFHQSLRIVTREGELLTPGGAMTGGAFKNSSNLLGRKRELDELSKELSEINNEIANATREETELRTVREELKSAKEDLNLQLQELYLQKNTVTLNIEQVSKNLAETANAFASVNKESKELESQIEEINQNKNELYDNHKQAEAAKKALEERIEGLEEQAAFKKDELKKSNERVSELMLEFNTIKQQDDFLIENLRRIRTEENKLKEELALYRSQMSDSGKAIENLVARINRFKDLIAADKKEIEELEGRLAKDIADKEELNGKHKEFFTKRESLNEEITGLDKSAFKLNAQIEKIGEQADNLSKYMWEEYELTYQSAVELKDAALNDLDSLKREVSAVKAKIKALGDVNVNAIEDYKLVSERYEFLKGQHDDIVKAESNLLQVIAELDTAMRTQFEEKFNEIQVMFDKVFRELFGGGKATLELVDNEDILEAGIRIIAQPPGKKLQNMMQLSGGEKALSAIALLFAIQSLKPSPFCLLDEIEAALDDSNVTRYAKYLNKLTKDTQFIVITHRKGTMEAADVLYGITMQEKGVSTLVSVNLIENELED